MRRAAERIGEATQQVHRSMENQTTSSQQILRALSAVSTKTKAIAASGLEQRDGAERIQRAVLDIRDIPGRNRALVAELE